MQIDLYASIYGITNATIYVADLLVCDYAHVALEWSPV